jgi:hypothetical protein
MSTLGRPAARAPINTADIPDGIITSAKVAADVLTAADIAPNAVTASELADDAVDTAAIVADAVTYAKLQNLGTANRVLGSASTGVIGEVQIAGAMVANDAIDSQHYAAGSVDATAIATDAVTTVKITALNVTTAKIAADAIDGTKLADDAVDSEHYAAASIDTAHIGDDQVTAAKVASDVATTAGTQTLTNKTLTTPIGILLYDRDFRLYCDGGASYADNFVKVSAESLILEDTSGRVMRVSFPYSGSELTITGTTAGANGLDTGTFTDGTGDPTSWYFVWIINNGSTTAGLLSLSPTTPTMPSGYTFKRLVGAARCRDVSGVKKFDPICQNGNHVNKMGGTTLYANVGNVAGTVDLTTKDVPYQIMRTLWYSAFRSTDVGGTVLWNSSATSDTANRPGSAGTNINITGTDAFATTMSLNLQPGATTLGFDPNTAYAGCQLFGWDYAIF